MNVTELLSQIDSEISRLHEARNLLTGHGTGNGRVVKPRRKRVLSAEARERIAAAQRRRWAKQKKAK
jgi:hypothetical protein